MQLVDENCVLFPRQLEFHWVDLPIPLEESIQIDNAHNEVKNTTETSYPAQDKVPAATETNETTATKENIATNEAAKKVKRDTIDHDENVLRIQHDENGTAITGQFPDR